MLQNNAYANFAKKVAHICGKPRTFSLAVAVIVVWILTGPLFAFSDTWQLVINTGTTIVTFLMVFLIQNTQNRDTEAIQLKLNASRLSSSNSSKSSKALWAPCVALINSSNFN